MESFIEEGQGPNWGCSAKEKKKGIYINADLLIQVGEIII
jgi:hypothetical protein